jgi:cytochrome b
MWGFVGTRYAQFRTFFFKPSEVIAYVMSLTQRNAKQYLGHNPAGSVAIWLLVLSGTVSGVTGVMALQDVGGDIVIEWHDLVSEAMLAIVAVHVLGVIASSMMHHENLVRSMVTGYKVGTPKQGIAYSYSWLGIAIVVAAAAFWLVYSA